MDLEKEKYILDKNRIFTDLLLYGAGARFLKLSQGLYVLSRVGVGLGSEVNGAQ